MSYTLHILVLQFVFFLFVAIGSIGVNGISQVEEIRNGFSNFSIDFYEQCVKSQPKNMIVSPWSVAMALSLLSQVTNGNSYEEIRKVLRLNNDKRVVANQFRDYYDLIQKSVGDSQLLVANRIFVQQDNKLKKDFQNEASEKFFSSIEPVDYKSNNTAKTINQSIKEKTYEKITEIVKSEDFANDTDLVLINAVWLGSPLGPVLSMSESEKQKYKSTFDYFSGFLMRVLLDDLGGFALRMDYKNSNTSLIFITPHNIDLATLEMRMKNYTLSSISDKMDYHCSYRRMCLARIPKIIIESELDLSDTLKRMGISEIFTDRANLNGLSKSNKPMKVKKVIHKVYFNFNEQDIISYQRWAALPWGSREEKIPPPIFNARPPFLFYIWDRSTDTIIFSGHVTNDTSKTFEL